MLFFGCTEWKEAASAGGEMHDASSTSAKCPMGKATGGGICITIF